MADRNLVAELETMQRTLTDLSKRRDQAVWKLEQALNQLKSEFGVETVEAAEAEAVRLEAEAKGLEEQASGMVEKIRAEFGELLAMGGGA